MQLISFATKKLIWLQSIEMSFSNCNIIHRYHHLACFWKSGSYNILLTINPPVNDKFWHILQPTDLLVTEINQSSCSTRGDYKNGTGFAIVIFFLKIN